MAKDTPRAQRLVERAVIRVVVEICIGLYLAYAIYLCIMAAVWPAVGPLALLLWVIFDAVKASLSAFRVAVFERNRAITPTGKDRHDGE